MKTDLIFKTTSYRDNKLVNKFITEEYLDLHPHTLIELVDDIALDAFFARSILTQDEKIKAIYEDIKATNKSVEDVSSEENEQTENVENESVEEVPDNVDIQTES